MVIQGDHLGTLITPLVACSILPGLLLRWCRNGTGRKSLIRPRGNSVPERSPLGQSGAGGTSIRTRVRTRTRVRISIRTRISRCQFGNPAGPDSPILSQGMSLKVFQKHPCIVYLAVCPIQKS